MTSNNNQNFENSTTPVRPFFTRHALLRMGQRNLSEMETSYVLQYGRLYHRTGICFYFLAARDIPPADRKTGWVQRLVGTTILVSQEGAAVITLYKNQKALREIRKKSKRRSILAA